MSKKQPQINSIFSVKKSHPIEQAFLRQCEEVQKECFENEQCVAEQTWAKEKSSLEQRVMVLEFENDKFKSKYEKIKAKHIELLQTLLTLEKKNQNLEIEIQSLKMTNDPKSSATEPIDKFSPCFEIENALVNIFFLESHS